MSAATRADLRLPVMPAPIKNAPEAWAWAEATLRGLGPAAAEPKRWLIEHALAAAVPLVGEPAGGRWGSGRHTEAWSGVVVGRCTSGFVVANKYRRFFSYVDLWARHALLDEPGAARARVQAVLQLLYGRMPKPRGTIRGMPDESRQGG